MSTYYGFKPIVNDGIVAYVHGLNSNGYNNESTWQAAIGDVEFEISNSETVKKLHRTRFRTDGATQDLTSLNDSVFNAGSGSWHFNFWFKTEYSGSDYKYIFDKGNQFQLILTGTQHLYMNMVSNDFGNACGIAVTGSYGFLAIGTGNQHSAMLQFDSETLEVIKSKWSYNNSYTLYTTAMGNLSIDSSSLWAGCRTYARIAEYDHVDDGWYHTQYKTPLNIGYSGTPSNIATQGRQLNAVDFNEDYVFHTSVQTSYAGLYGGWISKRYRDGTFITASFSDVGNGQSYGLCIDKTPSTGSNIYIAQDYEIVVMDQDTLTIQSRTGSYNIGYAPNAEPYGFLTPECISADENYIYVGDRGNYRIAKYRKSDLEFIIDTGSNSSTSDYYIVPWDVNVTDKYIYVASYNNTYSWISVFDKDTMEFIKRKFFGVKQGNLTYNYAARAIYSRGNYVFCPDRNGKVTTYHRDENGNMNWVGWETQVQSPHTDPWGAFFDLGVETEPTGFVWFCNEAGNSIDKWVYNSDYTIDTIVTRSWAGGASSAWHGWSSPRKMTVDWDNSWLYAIDQDNDRFKKLDLHTLNVLAITGSSAAGDYQMTSPYGICISASYVYVTDIGTDTIKKFNSDMEYQETVFSGNGGDFYNVEFDPYTNQFYVFRSNRQMWLYDHNWNFLRSRTYSTNEQFGSQINGFQAQVHIDEHFIIFADLYRRIFYDKHYLTQEYVHGAYTYPVRSQQIDVNNWNNVSIDFDGLAIRLYLNGEFQGSQSMVDEYSNNFGNREPLRLGKWNWNTYSDEFTDAEFGSFIVYNKSLTGTEVKQNYNALKYEYGRG